MSWSRILIVLIGLLASNHPAHAERTVMRGLDHAGAPTRSEPPERVLTGYHRVGAFVVPRGETIFVDDDLVIESTGAVVIEGRLLGRSGPWRPREQPAPSITIRSRSRVEIYGEARAADGRDGWAFFQNGQDAGRLHIVTPTLLVETGELRGSSGGRGGLSAAGGRGGDVIIEGAPRSTLPGPAVAAHAGRGGDGGKPVPAEWRPLISRSLRGDGFPGGDGGDGGEAAWRIYPPVGAFEDHGTDGQHGDDGDLDIGNPGNAGADGGVCAHGSAGQPGGQGYGGAGGSGQHGGDATMPSGIGGKGGNGGRGGNGTGGDGGRGGHGGPCCNPLGPGGDGAPGGNGGDGLGGAGGIGGNGGAGYYGSGGAGGRGGRGGSGSCGNGGNGGSGGQGSPPGVGHAGAPSGNAVRGPRGAGGAGGSGWPAGYPNGADGQLGAQGGLGGCSIGASGAAGGLCPAPARNPVPIGR